MVQAQAAVGNDPSELLSGVAPKPLTAWMSRPAHRHNRLAGCKMPEDTGHTEMESVWFNTHAEEAMRHSVRNPPHNKIRAAIL